MLQPIAIAHNYDFAQGKIPGRFRRGTEPTARRNVTSSVQTKYESGTEETDIFIRWDEKVSEQRTCVCKDSDVSVAWERKAACHHLRTPVLRNYRPCPCCGNGRWQYSCDDLVEGCAASGRNRG